MSFSPSSLSPASPVQTWEFSLVNTRPWPARLFPAPFFRPLVSAASVDASFRLNHVEASFPSFDTCRFPLSPSSFSSTVLRSGSTDPPLPSSTLTLCSLVTSCSSGLGERKFGFTNAIDPSMARVSSLFGSAFFAAILLLASVLISSLELFEMSVTGELVGGGGGGGGEVYVFSPESPSSIKWYCLRLWREVLLWTKCSLMALAIASTLVLP